MQQESLQILKHHGLSVTDSRKQILDLFKKANGALAHAHIEKSIAHSFDRVTIYRTLQTFVEKGIIHTIPTADNTVLYALCKDDCAQGKHNDNHVHFICDSCQTTFCLEHIHLPGIKLPNGFVTKRADMIVSGICKNCNA
jgi:Fur family ferric uptake transcriptional regulator